MVSSLWPVERHEYKKVLPMIAMSFLVCFNYTLLRDLKDILVLEKMHTNAILWLKLGLTLPASIIVMLVYTKMTMKMSKPAVFYSLLLTFVAFFTLFGAVLYPLGDSIQPGKAWVDKYIDITDVEIKDFKRNYPDYKHLAPKPYISGTNQSFVPILSIIAFWPTALLYVMSELWGTVVLSLLFWGFANEICRTEEAKRFYTLFNIGANASLIFCGTILIAMGAIEGNPEQKPALEDETQASMIILMGMVVIFSLCIMAIYRWMQINVLTDQRLCPPVVDAPTKKNKPKLGFTESLKVIFTSLYVALIGVMVIMYGISVNFMEIYYKDAWKKHFGKNKGDILMFQGAFSMGTGIIALNLLIFVGGKAVRGIGWTKTALITPVMIIATGFPFLIFYTINIHVSPVFPLTLIVAFGYLAVVFSKSCKYSFFDPTKEMSYIPLGEDRGRAKAAVDVVGARLGKSGGGLLQIGLSLAWQTKDCKAYIYVVAGLLCVSVLTWTFGTMKLGSMYNAKVSEGQEPLKTIELVGGEKTPESKTVAA